MKLSRLITSDREFREYSKLLKSKIDTDDHLPIVTNGLSGGAGDVFLAESVKMALECTKSPILILVSSESEREATAAMLADEGIDALTYKPRDLVFYNVKASHDVDRERLSVLSSVLAGRARCIISTPDAVMQTTMPKSILEASSISIAVGEEHSPEELCRKLTTLGFARCDVVDGKGQFSQRGDILDFWGGESENPVRIEFFGDEVEVISIIDPLTGAFIEEIDEISIYPAGNFVTTKERTNKAISMIQDRKSVV